MRTVEEFEGIILKSEQSGALVRLGDVARVELGAENYSASSRINGHPGAGLAVSSAPGADALATSDLVKEAVRRAEPGFPPGYKVAYANDTTAFIRLSINEVVGTLIEAIILVVIVMFVFLHSWRATLIPTIAVPVTLLGTFVVFYIFDFSINTLTLFGLVLAIGILVDDAIVVVENVERLLEENPEMTPKEATIQSMGEIQVALVAIAIVLSAVFLPMAFFGGSTGVIYRQFSVTMISAMILSTLVALILSPALTTSLLRQKNKGHDQPQGWLDRRFPAVTNRLDRAQRWFNHGFARGTDRYIGAIEKVVDRKWIFLAIYAIVLVLLVAMFARLPTSFLPTEDQGRRGFSSAFPPGRHRGARVKCSLRSRNTCSSRNATTLR